MTTGQMSVIDDDFIAYRVRVELNRQELKQAWLARELDVARDYLNRRVKGEVPFSAVELAKVAQTLGVELAVFFPAPVGCAA